MWVSMILTCTVQNAWRLGVCDLCLTKKIVKLYTSSHAHAFNKTLFTIRKPLIFLPYEAVPRNNVNKYKENFVVLQAIGII